MNIQDTLKSFADKVADNRQLLMGIASAVGTACTFIFTIRANKKANEKKKENPDLTPKEEAKCYILPGSICIATIGLEIANSILTKKEMNDLSSLALLGALYSNRVRAEKETGVEEVVVQKLAEEERAPKVIPDGYSLFYSEHHKKFFVDKYENVLWALYELEAVYQNNGKATFNVFWRALNNREVPPLEEFETLGWSKWHTTRSSDIPPIMMDLYLVPMSKADGTKYSWLEFPEPPEPDYDGY